MEINIWKFLMELKEREETVEKGKERRRKVLEKNSEKPTNENGNINR